MLKYYLINFIFISCCLANVSKYEEEKIESLKLNDAAVSTITELLSRQLSFTVSATEEAGAKKVNIFLKATNGLKAIEILCLSAKLAYRFDKNTDHFLIMTLEEYRNGIYLSSIPQVKVITVRPANLEIVGQSIQDLYGERISYVPGLEVREFDRVNSNSNSINGLNGSSTFAINGNNNFNNQNNRNLNNVNRNQNNNQLNNRLGNNGSGSSGSQGKEVDIEDLRKEIDFSLVSEIERSRINAKAGEMPQQVILNRLLPEKPTIFLSTNTEHSLIVIRSTDIEAIDKIEEYIRKVDKKVPQVLLEMKILELTVGDDFTSVFNYDVRTTNNKSFDDNGTIIQGANSSLGLGAAEALADQSLIFTHINENIIAQIQMLESENRVEALATPMLVAANNREAFIDIVTNEIFTTGARVESPIVDSNGIVIQPARVITETIQEDVGTKLKIIPRINEDKTVTLFISQETSSKIPNGGKIFVDGTDILIDIKSESKVQATVVAENLKTIAVGGLINISYDTVLEKTPFLSEIPLLGKLFTNEIKSEIKKELILLITPYVMDVEEGEEVTDKFLKKNSHHSYPSEGEKGVEKHNENLQKFEKEKQ